MYFVFIYFQFVKYLKERVLMVPRSIAFEFSLSWSKIVEHDSKLEGWELYVHTQQKNSKGNLSLLEAFLESIWLM